MVMILQEAKLKLLKNHIEDYAARTVSFLEIYIYIYG